MVNLNQISIELKDTLINRHFTYSIEFSAQWEFLQFPAIAKFINIFLINLFVCFCSFCCNRGIFLAGFLLQFLSIIIVNVTHPLKDGVFIVSLFIFISRYLIIVRILLENQPSWHHSIDNGISQGRHQENRHN